MLEIYYNRKPLSAKRTKIPDGRINMNTTIFLCLSAVMLLIGSYFVVVLIRLQKISNLPSNNILLSKSQIYGRIYSMIQQYEFEAVANHRYNKSSYQEDNVISCYYNSPDYKDTSQLKPINIHPSVCTHINVAFAQIINKNIYIDENLNKTLKTIINLKKINPKLKILLSVGGAGNQNGFSEMIINHAFRKEFIKSIKNTLRYYTLDGIDLDWEFPVLHNKKNVFANGERQHFTQLLIEIKKEYEREKRDYLLTVAAAAQQIIVDVAYDIDQLNLYVDYVNVMTYDFHSFTKFTPFTGLNSPLFARANEYLYLATLNINYTVHMYLDKGLDRNKIVIGIPTYGHTFTLVNDNNNVVGSPASGFGSLGSLGFVDYRDICLNMNSSSGVTIKREIDAKVPYFYRGKEWVSYDDCQSVADKARFAKEHGLRGVMVYSLNSDDYDGLCHENVKFPLMKCICDVLQMQ